MAIRQRNRRPKVGEDDQGGQTIQSVRRAAAILRAVSSSDCAVSISEISAAVGLIPSTVSRIAATLEDEGLLEQDRSRGKYYLGLGLLSLANAAVGQRVVERKSRPIMLSLARQTEESVNLGVLERGKVVYVARIQSHHFLRADIRVGTTIPAHSSAMGKVLLSYLPSDELDRFVEAFGLPLVTPNTITDPNEFKKHLSEVRSRQYAIDDEETTLGIRCVASPIRDSNGNVVAALSISGPTSRMTMEKIEGYCSLVVAAAADIPAALGYQLVDNVRRFD